MSHGGHPRHEPRIGAPARWVVCGVKYGVIYLDALADLPGVELAGILARGSDRSRWLAEQCGVPLFHSVTEVPNDVAFACIAVGGQAGDALAREFLDRGVHVLQEHPVGCAHLEDALRRASVWGGGFHINSHFSDLPAGDAFIREVQARREQGPPIFGAILASQRTTASVIDIVRLALGSLGAEPVAAAPTAFRGAFLLAGTRLAGAPFSLSLQGAGPVDDGGDSVVSHRITIAFPSGDVMLAGPYGPVVVSGRFEGGRGRRRWKVYGPSAPRLGGSTRIRVAANRVAVERLMRQAWSGERPDCQKPEHLLDVGAAVERIGEAVAQRQRHDGEPPL